MDKKPRNPEFIENFGSQVFGNGFKVKLRYLIPNLWDIALKQLKIFSITWLMHECNKRAHSMTAGGIYTEGTGYHNPETWSGQNPYRVPIGQMCRTNVTVASAH